MYCLSPSREYLYTMGKVLFCFFQAIVCYSFIYETVCIGKVKLKQVAW